jgi:hypothetical protein
MSTEDLCNKDVEKIYASDIFGPLNRRSRTVEIEVVHKRVLVV